MRNMKSRKTNATKPMTVTPLCVNATAEHGKG
nr:MAG TPA: hypothetical protein [Caudoviricetes sp.]